MSSFYLGLLLLCASTLMYEVILTRLLSVVSWYYLAFVSVSMTIFGMTAGALFVQVREDLFTEGLIRRRAFQATRAAAISMPLVLLAMLAIPLDLSRSLQTAYSFLLFSTVISVPFLPYNVEALSAATANISAHMVQERHRSPRGHPG